ncbi:hypothetical protein E3N88_16107 [Mikania micrantha]|uniref:Uncharacterized protein n=1 Tax=Mikania micrantha TaxID=192012 RepID=A0A5N6NYQ5_9ASTR|nr:hypothetical protein E3N88_16107 [Mikania micrantha]
MEITLKNVFLVIFIALVLASGTTKAEINFGRKIGFGTTKNQMIGNNEDDKIDTGVDSHHRYVFNTNIMAITLKKAWLMLFVALMLVLGTTGAEVDLGRKVGFGPTKNPVSGSPTDGNGDTEVDNHHSYRSTNRPETGD